eukprot:11588845-Heterocapsa_arctica.AAC.1
MACHNVEDWDVRCCMFVLLVQMIDRLHIQLDHPASSFRCVREVANNRKTICDTVLLLQESDGKELLNAVVNGQALAVADKSPQAQAFLTALSQEGRLLRWVA